MIEKPPTIEQGPEREPTEAEIESFFKELTEGEEFEKVRTGEDERGLYLWDIAATDEQGNTTEYSYMRKGQYPEGQASTTAVHVAYYDSDGTPVGGESVAKYKDGVWHRSVSTTNEST